MKYIIIIIFLFISSNFQSQCSLNLISSLDSVLCGDEIVLSAFGSMDGNIAFDESFNGGSPQGWQFTQSVTISNNTCGVPSPDGSDFMWMGDAATNPRDMTTVGLDLSPGGVICFEMRYAEQGDGSPCEGPDESDEGVFLKYSTDNGTTWIDIEYWDPNGGNDPSLTAWNQYCVTIPPGAMTANTMIQWHQDAVSGPEYDHWGIDNVQVTLDDPTSQISWQHDGYSYPTGSSGGENPNSIAITTETTFTATITNGTSTCTETITIPVKIPILKANAGTDVTICAGECVDLNAEAGVIVNRGGTKTYANSQPEDLSSWIGSIAAATNINVQNMNDQTVNNNSILSVCVDDFDAEGNFFSNLSEDDFELTLEAPDGTTIVLVPEGIATNGEYNQVCFTVGGGDINGGGFPTTGNWAPEEPFSDLAGSPTNGTWTLQFEFVGATAGSAELSGWNITFDDRDSLLAGIYSWAPTTNMTNETTLTPEVCPTVTTTYTLTVADSNACVTPITDDVTVTVTGVCCNFDITAVNVEPTCGNTDGSIDLTISNGSGNYTYDWGANGTTEDLAAIGQGIYAVTVTDVTAGCTKDTSFNFSSNAFDYTLNITTPTCGATNGAIEFVPSGGTTPFEYSIDNGVTFITTPTFSTLAENTYNLSIKDASGCRKDTIINLLSQSYDYSLTLTNPSCGNNDGSIVFATTGSLGPFGFSIDNGTTVSPDSNFIGLPSGTYNLLISDAGGCVKDSLITLNDVGSTSGTVNIVDLICYGEDNGRIILSPTGGTAPYTYDIGNGPQNTTVFNDLLAGTYNITISDNLGCTFDTVVTLQQPPAIDISLVISDPTCYNTCDASVVATVSGGTIANDPIYKWSGILSSQTGNSVTDVCINNYTLTITDDNGCKKDTVITFVAPADLYSNFSASPQPTTMFNPDITLSEESINGNSFKWYVDSLLVGIGNEYTHTYPSDSAGTYNTCLVIEDALGCTDSICKEVIIDEDFIVFLPNTFTPDGDGDNDFFYPKGLGLNLIEYDLLIFDRWGTLIWTSGSSNDKWDGTHKGIECQDGVYLWKLSTKDQGINNIERMGHVNLLR